MTMTKKPIKEVDVPVDNYIVINFGYSLNLIFPHAEGMQVIAALNKAENIEIPSYNPGKIKPIDVKDLSINNLSRQSYVEYKMNNLLLSEEST